MNYLTVIWAGCFFMAALSLIGLAGVIARRIQQSYRAGHVSLERLRARELLLSYLLGWVSKFDATRHMRGRADEGILQEAVIIAKQCDDRQATELRTLLHTIVLQIKPSELTSRFRRRRMRAIFALSFFGGGQVIEALRTMLDDPDTDIRLAAAKALAEIGALPPTAELIRKLDPGPKINSRVLLAIFRNFPDDRLDELLELIHEDTPETALLVILDTLGHSGRQEICRDVVRALGFMSLNVRAEALRALARLGNPVVRGPVTLALADQAWEVRCQAAVCAGRLGLVDTIPRLADMMKDDNWWVRFRAAEALHDLGGEGHDILADLATTSTEAGHTPQTVLQERAA